MINRHTFIAEDLTQPYRELFVWAVVNNRIPLAMILWKECPDPIGSALVASLIIKTMPSEQLTDELVSDTK